MASIKSRAKHYINVPLGALGFELRRKTQLMPTCTERLCHVRTLGFSPKVIVDGGAYKGEWSVEVAAIFRGARMVLIEPNPHLHSPLIDIASHLQPPATALSVALGETPGKAFLKIHGDINSDMGASLLDHVEGRSDTEIEVDVATLDHIAGQLNVRPDLIKLDLQGAELAALRGGTHVLAEAELVVVEFGCLEAYVDRATPNDIMEFMYRHEYVLYDIVDCHYRPFDGAMTGGDFLFVKTWSRLRSHKGWQ